MRKLLLSIDLKFLLFFFFLSGFSFTDTDNSQFRRGREGTFFLFHCTTSTASWTSRHLFATLYVRRLDEIYHLIELPLIDDVMLFFCSFTWWLGSRFLLQIFGPILPKKGISRFQKKRNAIIGFSIFKLIQVPCLRLNENNFDFWIKFSQKVYFHPKRENLNITIELSMLKLMQVPNFRVKWQSWCFRPNLPNKDISQPKQDKWTLPSNSAYSN